MSLSLQQAAIEACQGRTHLATLINFDTLIRRTMHRLDSRLAVHFALDHSGTRELQETTAEVAEKLSNVAGGLARYIRAHAASDPGDPLAVALVQATVADVLACTGA